MNRTKGKCFSQCESELVVADCCGIAPKIGNKSFLGLLLPKMILLLLLFMSLSFDNLYAKSNITETKYDIEGVETGKQGTYLVKVYVYSKKPSVTSEEFKYAAVHGVIFRGFERKGYGIQKPMAKPEAQTEHADYFDDFFKNGDYVAYAQVVNPVADRVKVGKEYKLAAVVSVLKDELRKTLEGAGVIHSLNSAF